MQPKKVVLLYSGGLDTSVMLKWIPDHYADCEMVTLTLDLGQGEDLEFAKQKALDLGAVEAHVIDVREEFAEKFIAPAIKSNALYQQQYPLATALARPLIAEIAVDLAHRVGADTIAHGCTGKGNDQVRFEVSIRALDPSMNIIAPIRQWDMSRDMEIQYAKDNNIPLPDEVNKEFSVDANLWGRSIESGVLEDPNHEPPSHIFAMAQPPEQAPDEPDYATIQFEKGLPVAVDGQKMSLVDLIDNLNIRAGRAGVGIIDMAEDRVVGLKSREIYESPAAVALITAHRDLERFCSTLHQNEFKPLVDQRWGEVVYKGLWHDPIRTHLQAFAESANEKVTGSVRVKLYKGHAQVVGRESEFGIYDENLVTYQSGHTYNQEDAVGFIQLWGLPTVVANKEKQKL
jgi:argininosuccinate synthase